MTSLDRTVVELSEDALKMVSLPLEVLFALDRAALEQIHLAALRKRFANLRTKLPALEFLADDNRIVDFDSINDVAPLLFPHTEYKSYPLALIDNGQFTELNDWLGQFTTHSLSSLEVTDCQSLDDWLRVVEQCSPVRVVSSSGTSGKISLLPRSTTEEACIVKQFEIGYGKFRNEAGFEKPYGPNVYHVLLSPRHGPLNSCRSADARARIGFNGDDSHVLTLGGTLSADVLWMTGRMKKAQTDGMVEQLKATKAWQRLNARLESLESGGRERREALYRQWLIALRGRSVAMAAGHLFYWEMLELARRENLEIAFADDSCFLTAGGAKGMGALTADQIADIEASFPNLNDVYGCSELIALARRCPEGHYHLPPSVVMFVLEPETGVPYPRTGTCTGRFAAFDLFAQTYWGGVITGDKVTVDWEGGCPCGRAGPFLEGGIVRFQDITGGDDKITCQRTAAAVEEMMASMKGASP